MAEPSTLCKAGEHLSDIHIAIRTLDKVSIPQQKFMGLIKCSCDAVQRALTTYDFETFQGRNPRWKYQRRTIKPEDRYIECALKQNKSLPLCDITNIITFHISE